MLRLMEGKVGIVTGAGSGIGRASAIAFACEGACVVAADFSPKAGTETVNLIKDTGGEAIFVQCDISNEESVRELVEQTVQKYGRLDWAHNNAGISNRPAYIAESETNDWERVLKVNLDGMFYSLKYEIEAMLKTGGGAIVNTSSQSGLTGVRGKSPYVATKWGVNGMTKTAALEYGKYGIRVNSICPGMTVTPLVERFITQDPEQSDSVKNAIPLGRLSTSEEQANAAVWLCSDKASFITGVNLAVDGGLDAQSFSL